MTRTILILLFALFARVSDAIDMTWNPISTPPRNQQIHLAVLLPSKPVDEMSERSTQVLATTLPVIELAIKAVEEKRMLEGVQLIINSR